MILSIVSLVIGVLSLSVSLFAIFDARRTNKATERLLNQIESTVIEAEKEQVRRIAIVKKLIDGKDYDEQ